MQVEKVTLEGEHVRLEPLGAEHLVDLADAIRDGELWKLPVTIVPHPDALPDFLRDAERALEAGRELTFATRELRSGRVVGSTRFRCIEALHLRVEIGFTFIAAKAQRSHVNSEAKLLMLTHAFETWQVNRVELLTDFLNEKSRSAIQRLGATQEGLLRSHMVMRDGRIRDSVVFSLIRREWPQAKEALRQKMASHS